MPASSKISGSTLSLLLALFTMVSGTTVFARMAPPRKFVFSQYIETSKNQSSSETDVMLLRLSQFATEVAGLEDATYYGSLGFEPILKDVDRQMLSKWSMEIDKTRLEKISDNKSRLKRLLGSSSITWAWSLKQLGEDEKAKAILTESFENEYDRVQGMKRITSFGGRGGQSILTKSRALVEALENLSSGEEKKSLQDKLRKMKAHISKLPVSKVVTSSPTNLESTKNKLVASIKLHNF